MTATHTAFFTMDGSLSIANINRFCRITGANTIGLAVAAGQEVGVLVVVDGTQGEILTNGQPVQITAGATINPGDRVTTDATGRAIVAASGGWGVVVVGATVGNLATVMPAAPSSVGGGGPFVPPAGYVIQTVSVQVTANTTKTGTAFATLLSAPITTSGANRLNIRAAGAVSIATANVNARLRIVVDGVSQGGVQLRSPATNIGTAFAIERTLVVAAGARSVLLEWAPLSSTIQCRPVANPDAESASLVVQEVKV